MNERFVFFGFLLWTIDTTDAAVAAVQRPPQPYGICIDVTLCQQPPYHQICSKGLPICPTTATKPATQPATTPTLPTTVKVITAPVVSKTHAITSSTVPKTIAPTKTTVIVHSTKISPGKEVNVLTIQNNFKINFGKKSNVTHEPK